MKTVLIAALACIASNLFAIELTDLPNYQEGTVESTLTYSYPSTPQKTFGTSTATLAKTENKMNVKCTVVFPDRKVSFIFIVDLKKDKCGKYKYAWISDKDAKVTGTLEILSPTKTKAVDDQTGSYSICATEELDDKTVVESIICYNKAGMEEYRLENRIKYTKRKESKKVRNKHTGADSTLSSSD